jgi:dTDP-4-dehydrorhamnose 3,5-epimerase
LWNDPALGIDWPVIDGELPILSAKDAKGSLFAEAETYD